MKAVNPGERDGRPYRKLLRFVKATELPLADPQRRRHPHRSSQQALGGLRAVADYRDKDIWWVGQDLAQIGIPEGYKVLSASSTTMRLSSLRWSSVSMQE